MGDVIIRIGEGVATVLALLGASVLIVAVVSIFFPVAAIIVGLCICGPLSAPFGAIMASCGMADASKEHVRRSQSQWERACRNLEKSTERLETADRDLLIAQQLVDDAELISDIPPGKFQFWGRLKRAKQRFEASSRCRRLNRASDKKKQAEIDLNAVRIELQEAERARADAIKSHKRKLLFHTVFTIAIVVGVLWALYLLPPP